MADSITLKAREGYYWTNGEVYGKQIRLAEGIDPNTYYEISEQQYMEKFLVEDLAVMPELS